MVYTNSMFHKTLMEPFLRVSFVIKPTFCQKRKVKKDLSLSGIVLFLCQRIYFIYCLFYFLFISELIYLRIYQKLIKTIKIQLVKF